MKQAKFYQVVRLIIILLVVWGVSASSKQNVVAQPFSGTGWATWEIEVHFPKGDIEAQLMVTTGYYDEEKEEEVVLPVYKTTLECKEHGWVPIEKGVATFSGDSYFSCEVPSIAEIAYHMTDKQLIIGAQCECKDPWIIGNISPESKYISSEPLNPIFYRDDLQISSPILGGNKSRLEFNVDNVSINSANFSLGQPFYEFMAEFVPSYGTTFRFVPSFEVNRTHLTAIPSSINQQLFLSTEASTIYIGYNPVDDAYFEGQIERLNVDPACFGRG